MKSATLNTPGSLTEEEIEWVSQHEKKRIIHFVSRHSGKIWSEKVEHFSFVERPQYYFFNYWHAYAQSLRIKRRIEAKHLNPA